MRKETITYVDYDNNTRTEDFYFNLNKAEIIDLQMGEAGGLEQMLKKIISTQDNTKLIKIFKEIILKSYGEKSPDGKRFIKNAELREAFEQTEAFSNLYVKLATDADYASEFVNGILPKDLAEQANKEANNIVPINN